MAGTKLMLVAATLVILLQATTCAVARHHGKPDPCDGGEDDGPEQGMPHKQHRKPPHCPSPGGGGGTPGVMTVNGFERGEEGGGPAACDGKYHSDKDMIAALSTRWYAGGRRWYAGGRRCHKTIRITSKKNGRTVEARVVDECDSNHGCKDDVVDTSAAVWKALGLDTDVGVVPVTWSDA